MGVSKRGREGWDEIRKPERGVLNVVCSSLLLTPPGS